VAGVPLDTHDGFLHLGWAVGWARQVTGGWWWPLWSDLNWAGAGTFVLAMYPPLFRLLVGVPLLTGVAPDHAVAGALLVLLLLNTGGALALARVWLPAGPWRWLLLTAAALNPYLLVNVYVRGAWPEALAQVLLWWLIVGLVGIQRQRPWGLVLATAALAGIVLSNWNSALLALILWGIAAGGLAWQRRWSALLPWGGALVITLGVTAPFWRPALELLPSVRPPIPTGLLPWEFLTAGAAGNAGMARLLWIQIVILALLLAARWLGWGGRSDGIGSWGLTVALVAMVMMLPVSQPIYDLVAPLQRIQFPWRWFGPAWLGTLLWLCSAALTPKGAEGNRPWRRFGLGLALLAALGCWFDSLWRFRTNVVGHAPSRQERMAMRQLLACDPLAPCPQGVRSLAVGGELAKRFAALGDGRIALAGVPDYSPASVPEHSWNKRLQTFWLPAWPQSRWAALSVAGTVSKVNRSPTKRTLRVALAQPGQLRLMQWAHPLWNVQWRPAPTASQPQPQWSAPLRDGGRDADGWISMSLPAGRFDVALTYGQAR